ncbi:hypothetical protein ACE1AT_09670 [Pelatocladus sp. BLCC-F211]|uniref:hypothetical protein n=1 Tax=Pelatocladus sp. BLCC-F211 TaxID=3342752 RepID=UPI0035B9E0D2
MSVSLFIKYANAEKSECLIPVSTEEIFREYWQPASSKLNLQWVPLFQTGIPLEKDDVPYVIEELEKLKQFFLEMSQADTLKDESDEREWSEVREYITLRIQNLITELYKLEQEAFVEMYVG